LWITVFLLSFIDKILSRTVYSITSTNSWVLTYYTQAINNYKAYMKRLMRLSLAVGEAGLLQFLLATPAGAQTATPSSESTASALPEAGTFSMSLILVLFGLLLVVAGIVLSLRTAEQEA
jgi:hypothetical protein